MHVARVHNSPGKVCTTKHSCWLGLQVVLCVPYIEALVHPACVDVFSIQLHVAVSVDL